MAFSLSAGSAVRVHTSQAPGSPYMRLLRKSVASFSGPDDPSAILLVDEFGGDYWLDSSDALVNGTEIFYRCYDWNGAAWVDQGVSFAATPAASYIPDTLDVQEFVRDRVQLGVTAAIAAQRLSPASGVIQVLTAPFSLAENTTFPCVSVHLETTGPEIRGLGDELMDDILVPDDDTWQATEGWLARTSLNVVAVSQNADERIQLRKVLRQIIQANLPVFSGVGMSLVEFSQSDTEEFRENNVPLYMSSGSFSCVAPAWIRVPIGEISEVTLRPGAQTPYSVPSPDFYSVQDA
jgi:hypothetical protein